MRARDPGLGAVGRINLIDKTLIKPLNATAKKTKLNTKPIIYSESTSKIMVRSRWKFSRFCLCQHEILWKNV